MSNGSRRYSTTRLGAAAVAVMLLTSACSKKEPKADEPGSERASPTEAVKPGTTPASPTPATPGLTVVTDRSQVCMVTNQFMGSPQIPIAVEGKTYYGCCEMCKGRLGKDPSVRTAIDPVSKKPVDKATALIAKTESGSLLYFENEQNVSRYTPGSETRAN